MRKNSVVNCKCCRKAKGAGFTTSARQRTDLCSRTVVATGSGSDSCQPGGHKNALASRNRNLLWKTGAEVFQSHLDLRQDLAFARRRDRVHPQAHLPVCSNKVVTDKQPKSPHEKRMKSEPLTSHRGKIDCVEAHGHTHADEDIDQGAGGPGGCRGDTAQRK